MGNIRVKTNRLRSVSALIVCATTLVFSNAAAFAAPANSASTTPAASNQELKVTPVKTDITVAPGATGKVQIIVTNLTSNTLTVQPIENDFVSGGEEGQAALILNPSTYAPEHSLKRFMVPLSAITLPPKGGQTVNVSIVVPKTAQAGGYFGALRFSPSVSGTSGAASVALGESVASLILMTVPGPTYEQLTLTNFDVQQNGSTSSNFRTPDALSLFVRFENKGNLQESPFGQINVQKGKKILYTYNFNQVEPKAEIIPDSFRRWSIPLKGFGKFGKYTISGTFTYGDQGQSIDVQKTVWIIPTLYIMLVVGLIAFLLLAGGGSWFFLKSYKRRILKSSRRRY